MKGTLKMKRMEARTLARCLVPGDRVRVNLAPGPDEPPQVKWIRVIAVEIADEVVSVDYGSYGVLCTTADCMVRIRPCSRGVR